MKPFIRILFILLTISISAGCVSSWISRGTAKGRDVLKPGASEAAISKRFGPPLAVVPEFLAGKISRDMRSSAFYRVWKVKGRPAQSDDGSGEATVSAMTLGLGEVFLIPMALARSSAQSTQTYYLIGYFSKDEKLLHHMAVEEKK
ncbi:MAG: hypothetical protein QM715_18255 [Nibricoccus sp.]